MSIAKWKIFEKNKKCFWKTEQRYYIIKKEGREVDGMDCKQRHKEYINIIGTENFLLLCRAFGGTSIYIPKEEEFLRKEKYHQIAEEFNGENVKELAIKYGVSERTVYTIIKRNCKRKQEMKGQMNLFDAVHLDNRQK